MSPRPTMVFIEQEAKNVLGQLVHVVVGLFFMAIGGWMVVYTIQHPPITKMLMYGGAGAALFGALIMPTIFPLIKEIFVFVVPYIPVLGGRRAADPPAPPRAIEEPPPNSKP